MHLNVLYSLFRSVGNDSFYRNRGGAIKKLSLFFLLDWNSIMRLIRANVSLSPFIFYCFSYILFVYVSQETI